MALKAETLPWPRRVFESVKPISARIVRVANQQLIQVCSTQYLGIAWNPAVRKQIKATIAGQSSSLWSSFGSNYLGGTHPLRLELEGWVARETGSDAALAFASGWAANYAVAETIGRLCGMIVSDKRNHNSIIHGLRASGAKCKRADFGAMKVVDILREFKISQGAIISTSVEGITGESAIPEIPARLRTRVLWVLDECHSCGAIGRTGFERFQSTSPDLRVLGLSKACGTMGAVVVGKKHLVDLIAQRASPWIFSTAVPPMMWKIHLAIARLIMTMSEERMRISSLAAQFREMVRRLGLHCTGDNHISGLHLATDTDPAQIEQWFRRQGFFVKVSQFPSRPVDAPCMRVAFNPVHSDKDVVKFAKVVEALRDSFLRY
jgi:8-amino-7-oxononanoate synthase